MVRNGCLYPRKALDNQEERQVYKGAGEDSYMKIIETPKEIVENPFHISYLSFYLQLVFSTNILIRKKKTLSIYKHLLSPFNLDPVRARVALLDVLCDLYLL